MRRERHEGVEDIQKVFWKEAKVGLKKHWILLIYLVLMMAGFNFMVSHPPSSLSHTPQIESKGSHTP